MQINNARTLNPNPLSGNQIELLEGTEAISTEAKFAGAVVGSMYIRRVDTCHIQVWVKGTDNDLATDWSCISGVIAQNFTRAQMTDGGSTVGTLVLTSDIPAGAHVWKTALEAITGFTGDTSAVITVGDGTDVDRYNTGTPSVFTTVGLLSMGVPSGTAYHATAVTAPTITITSAADFTNVAAGAATVRIQYTI